MMAIDLYNYIMCTCKYLVFELQFEMKIEVFEPHEKTCVIVTGKEKLHGSRSI